ncbi:penicillin-binding protein, partial [Actinotalea ferrariae]|uniref:transglycosylase domain-containing protein n=1 Tax=Actinotalea ferrariae TaxID=1386098 RepID=UPI001C8C8871
MVSPVPARPRGRQVNALQALALLLAFFLMAGVGGLLTAGLVMPAVATTSTLTDTGVRLFDELPSELEQVPLSEKSVILAADGTLLATFYSQNRIVVPLDQISIHMQHAVIATEDRRFYDHGGVDLQGIARAAMKTLTTEDKEGGSTLTQQYVKNALIQAALTADTPEARAAAIDAARESEGMEGIARKLREAKTALALEERMTKDEILEAYLNISQFGLSVYGVEAAAQYFFSTSAANLNYLQAATIAGITQAPGDFDPVRNPEAAQGRRDTVLGLMLREEFITQEEHDAGVATPIAATLAVSNAKLGCVEANAVFNAGYFCDFVTKIIANDPAFGETMEERTRLLLTGGLTITTTLVPGLQQAADEEVKNGIPVLDPSGVASAISVVEPGTGKVVAMAQNRIFNSAEVVGPGETAVNYNTDKVYGSSNGFHPGSTFKPFTLVQWLKEGHSLNEVIDARKMEYAMRDFNSPACGAIFTGQANYKFGNAEGPAGVMSALDATRKSVNSGYIRMASELDLCGIFDTAASLGVHKADGNPVDVVPSNVLGSTEIAPLTMAAAFAAFAANGIFCEPVAITSVVDTHGAQLPVPQPNCRQAISPEIAAAMNFALSGVWNGTASDVNPPPGRPSAGKTGTTSHNEYTWFVGYTPQLASAVWVGFPDAMRPVQDMTINGRWVRNAFGSTIAAPTWSRFMTRALDGVPAVPFPAPNSRQVQGAQVRVPDVAFRTEAEAQAALANVGFEVRTDPTPVFSPAPAGSVAGTSPAAGSSAARGSVVTIQLSAGPDPAGVQQTSSFGRGGGDQGGGEQDGGGPGGG